MEINNPPKSLSTLNLRPLLEDRPDLSIRERETLFHGPEDEFNKFVKNVPWTISPLVATSQVDLDLHISF